MVEQAYTMIRFDDFENEDNRDVLDKLNTKNESLYSMIQINLQANMGAGIRSDILAYLANTAEKIPDDMGIRNTIVSMALSEKFDEAWYSWAISYFLNDEHMDAGEFDLIISSAKNKAVTLDQVREVFDKYGGNFKDIVKEVKDLTAEEELDTVSASDGDTDVSGQTDLAKDRDFFSENKAVQIFPKFIAALSTPAKSDARMIAEMIDTGEESVQKIKQILDVFFAEKLSNYATEWNHDKEEIARLNSVAELQKQFIKGQQEKIDELTALITELYDKLHAAEIERAKNEKLVLKIKELQGLAQAETFSAFMNEE